MKTTMVLIATLVEVYIALGALYALYFALAGGSRLDANLKVSKRRVRLLLMPGALALWPVLLLKSLKK